MAYFEKFPPPGAHPPGPIGKIVAFIVTVALVGVALMFSVVLFAIVLTAGVVAWAYLWWKTRDLRRQMREQRQTGRMHERPPRDGTVIEGEVIREVDEREPGER